MPIKYVPEVKSEGAPKRPSVIDMLEAMQTHHHDPEDKDRLLLAYQLGRPPRERADSIYGAGDPH